MWVAFWLSIISCLYAVGLAEYEPNYEYLYTRRDGVVLMEPLSIPIFRSDVENKTVYIRNEYPKLMDQADIEDYRRKINKKNVHSKHKSEKIILCKKPEGCGWAIERPMEYKPPNRDPKKLCFFIAFPCNGRKRSVEDKRVVLKGPLSIPIFSSDVENKTMYIRNEYPKLMDQADIEDFRRQINKKNVSNKRFRCRFIFVCLFGRRRRRSVEDKRVVLMEPLSIPILRSDVENKTVYIRNEYPKLMDQADIEDFRRNVHSKHESENIIVCNKPEGCGWAKERPVEYKLSNKRFKCEFVFLCNFGKRRSMEDKRIHLKLKGSQPVGWKLKNSKKVVVPDKQLVGILGLIQPDEERLCTEGSTKILDCNYCVCVGGQLYLCTARNCGSADQSDENRRFHRIKKAKSNRLRYFNKGATCIEGENVRSFDDCNRCYCGGGEIHCTRKHCSKNGVSAGKCKPGEYVPSPDGCNDCACNTRGTIVCTAKTCGPVISPDLEGMGCTPGTWYSIDGNKRCKECYCINGRRSFCYINLCNPALESTGQVAMRLSLPGSLPDHCDLNDYMQDKCTKCYCGPNSVWSCKTRNLNINDCFDASAPIWGPSPPKTTTTRPIPTTAEIPTGPVIISTRTPPPTKTTIYVPDSNESGNDAFSNNEESNKPERPDGSGGYDGSGSNGGSGEFDVPDIDDENPRPTGPIEPDTSSEPPFDPLGPFGGSTNVGLDIGGWPGSLEWEVTGNDEVTSNSEYPDTTKPSKRPTQNNNNEPEDYPATIKPSTRPPQNNNKHEDRGPYCKTGSYFMQGSQRNCQGCFCTGDNEWKCWSIKGRCKGYFDSKKECVPGTMRKNPLIPCSLCYCGYDKIRYCAVDGMCADSIKPSKCENVACLKFCTEEAANFGVCHQDKCICVR